MFALTTNSISAQNIYLKPILGSQHGLFKFHNPQSTKYFDMGYKQTPFNWQINLYAGITLEWQKDENQRFELSYATNEVSDGFEFNYYKNPGSNNLEGNYTLKSYGARSARNLSLNYARILFNKNYVSGRRLSFEGIMGASYLNISKLFVHTPTSRRNTDGSFEISDFEKEKRFHGAALSLGFASRFYTIVGKPAVEVRFQYSQGLTHLGTYGINYEVKGQKYYSESKTRGSMISISLGIPMRILNLNKNKRQD